MSIYDYSVPTPDGTDLDLKQYEGKVIMIVNTATGCGFTPQYEDLEQIYHDCHDKGLEIIDLSLIHISEPTRLGVSSAASDVYKRQRQGSGDHRHTVQPVQGADAGHRRGDP